MLSSNEEQDSRLDATLNLQSHSPSRVSWGLPYNGGGVRVEEIGLGSSLFPHFVYQFSNLGMIKEWLGRE